MAKYNIYAVAIGVDPITKEVVHNRMFNNWNDCKPYVVGIEGAKYKGFLTPEEATTWMNKINGNVPSNETAMMKSLNDSVYTDEFKSVCAELGVFPKEMSVWLQKKFVDEHRFIKAKADLLSL